MKKRIIFKSVPIFSTKLIEKHGPCTWKLRRVQF